MKKIKSIISIVLSFVMLLNMTSAAFAKSTSTQLSYNGYDIKEIQNNFNVVKVSHVSDTGTQYVMTFNKINRNIDLAITDTDVMARSAFSDQSLSEKYRVLVDEADPTEGEVSAFSLVSADGKEYNISNNSIQPRAAFLIPIGIALGEALIQALLLAAGAIIIGGVAYVVAEEAAAVAKKQKTYKYFDAVLRNNKVFVGNGISTNAAKGVMKLNSKTVGVFATSASYARGLCSSLGGYRFDTAHGSSSGYWDHYHCNLYPNAHCWFTY